MATEAGRAPEWPDASVKPDMGSYPAWLEALHGVKIREERVRYNSARPQIVAAVVEEGTFWAEFVSQREDLAEAYESETGFKLFAFEFEKPHAKSWESFLLKTYRRNVLDNDRFPEEPPRGWLLPPSWLTNVHDVVRTVVVVKYLDGVKYVTDALEKIAAIAGASFQSDLQARDTGYYAAHTYTTFDVELPEKDWDLKRYTMELEVQVTTQLQEVMGKLTHKQYERRREAPASASLNWQWDHASDAFQPNYLGHILHYAEGMIMEIRNRDGA